MPRVKGFMPPQGILVVASYLPQTWEVRLIDENIKSVTKTDYQWADAIIVSGMHIQKPRIKAINELAHKFDKITILGGPSVSGCPEYYPDFDILHLGELGDATDKVIEYIDNHQKKT